MKKFGFTLAEVLIALSIIAVASAILAPAYVKIKPDKYKFKVIKCFNLASEVTEKMLSNKEIYYRSNVQEGTDVTNLVNPDGTFKTDNEYGCNGLDCTQMPLPGSAFNTNAYEGNCKYPNLMMAMLNLENVTQCSNSVTPHKATGVSQEQIEWSVQRLNGGLYGVTVDLDSSSNSSNCVYKKDSPNQCLHPDKFQFVVTIDGDIRGMDNLTKVYLKNITNLDKSADYEAAAQ